MQSERRTRLPQELSGNRRGTEAGKTPVGQLPQKRHQPVLTDLDTDIVVQTRPLPCHPPSLFRAHSAGIDTDACLRADPYTSPPPCAPHTCRPECRLWYPAGERRKREAPARLSLDLYVHLSVSLCMYVRMCTDTSQQKRSEQTSGSPSLHTGGHERIEEACITCTRVLLWGV